MHTCQIHVCRSGFLRWLPAGLCVSRMITIEHLLSAIQSLLKTYCCSRVFLGTIFVFWVWSTLYHFKLDFWIRSAIMHACVLQYLQEMPMQQIQVNTARTAEVHDRKLTLQPDNISILSGPLKLYRAARHQQSSFVMTCQMVPANGCQHTACVPLGRLHQLCKHSSQKCLRGCCRCLKKHKQLHSVCWQPSWKPALALLMKSLPHKPFCCSIPLNIYLRHLSSLQH